MDTSDVIAFGAAVIALGSLWYARVSAKASLTSASAAKAAVDFQIETHRKEKSATLRFVPTNIHGHTIQTRIDNDILWMTMHLSNVGPHWASDVRLTATIYEHAVASENPPIAVAPNSKEPIYLPVNLSALPRQIRTTFPLWVQYLDGNGLQHSEFEVMMEGSQEERNIHAQFLTPA